MRVICAVDESFVVSRYGRVLSFPFSTNTVMRGRIEQEVAE
ncbi:hypothetical protein [Novipirellula galeiformis]|nr:hypothetical protein [Novipirellula galeiformis]